MSSLFDLYFDLNFFILVLSMRCHICGNTELSSNKEFFAGKCESENDLGKHEDDCPWEDNQYCLKLKITFNLEVRRTTQFLENSFLNTASLSLIPQKQRDEIRKQLQKRKNHRLIGNRIFYYFVEHFKNCNVRDFFLFIF